MNRLLLLASVVNIAMLSACPDWSAFGDDDDDDTHPNEGEGEANEGEGEANEGEGEGLSGPRWSLVDAPVTARAELAAGSATALSSAGGRLFAVGATHLFELVDDELTAVADVAVPCADERLTGPVAVDGTDLLVASNSGAVRFHADGSCNPPYTLGTATEGLAAFAGAALMFDGQTLRLIDEQGGLVDEHAFDTFTEGAFFDDASPDAVLLVRGSPTSPGQVVRITMPGAELVIAVVADTAGLMVGAEPAYVGLDTRFGATFVDLFTGEAPEASGELRVSDAESINDVTSDPAGEIAVVGNSALLAHANVTTPADVTSISGARFGTLRRIARAPGGEVWAIGDDVILYWSAASASAWKQPDIVHQGFLPNTSGAIVAIDGSLFFSDENIQLHRADVDGDALDIVQVVDGVSFNPITLRDSNSRAAFLPASGSDPARLVVTTFDVAVYELDDDLGAVTASLFSSGFGFFTTPSAVAVLDDASKAAFLVSSTLNTCTLDLPVGQTPVATCDAGRSTSISFPSALTVIDPSVGVDDETYVVSGSNAVSIVEPGESGRVIGVDADSTVRPLLVNDCLLAFSTSSRSWSAVNQAQPLAPAARRGFPVSDAAVLGDRILLVGPDDGRAGRVARSRRPRRRRARTRAGTPAARGRGHARRRAAQPDPLVRGRVPHRRALRARPRRPPVARAHAVIAVLLALSILGASPPTQRVYVAKLRGGEGVDASATTALEEAILVAAKKARPDITVIGRGDVAMLADLRAEQEAAGCDAESCAAEIADALGAPQIVTGKLSHVGSTWILSLTRLERGSLLVLARDSVEKQGSSAEVLIGDIQPLVRRMFADDGAPPKDCGDDDPKPRDERPAGGTFGARDWRRRRARRGPRRGRGWRRAARVFVGALRRRAEGVRRRRSPRGRAHEGARGARAASPAGCSRARAPVTTVVGTALAVGLVRKCGRSAARGSARGDHNRSRRHPRVAVAMRPRARRGSRRAVARLRPRGRGVIAVSRDGLTATSTRVAPDVCMGLARSAPARGRARALGGRGPRPSTAGRPAESRARGVVVAVVDLREPALHAPALLADGQRDAAIHGAPLAAELRGLALEQRLVVVRERAVDVEQQRALRRADVVEPLVQQPLRGRVQRAHLGRDVVARHRRCPCCAGRPRRCRGARPASRRRRRRGTRRRCGGPSRAATARGSAGRCRP